MLHIEMPIIVEGKYDMIKLANITDAVLIKTDGFGIFKDREKRDFIKRQAEQNGIIILTDSDYAGGMIRSYLKGIVPNDKIYDVFLPPVLGKEKRKAKPSAEGILGVEGTRDEEIIKALKRFVINPTKNSGAPINAAYLVQLGISGQKNSTALREQILKKLELPHGLSTNTFIKILNQLTTREQLKNMVEEIING